MILFFKILAMWTLVSIALGLCIGPVIRWGLNHDLPEIPPLPSGSIDRDGLAQ